MLGSLSKVTQQLEDSEVEPSHFYSKGVPFPPGLDASSNAKFHVSVLVKTAQ